MGGKKKKAGGGGKEGDEEDLSVDNFMKAYRKKCTELACEVSKNLKEKYELYQEEGDPIDKFHFWEELGWQGIRAITDSLRQVQYPHAKTMCLWKTFCEDEGVRAVCQCLVQLKTVFKVDLLDNKFTALGCEFIGKMVHPKSNTSIEILKLDHNDFGSKGMVALAEGLAINKTIKNLSLSYCNIDAGGARALFEVLIFSQSQLEELYLNGNHFRNEGVITILRGVSINKNLKMINLADNQFNDDGPVMDAVENCWRKNKSLGWYNFAYNNLFDNNGIQRIIDALGSANHVYKVEVSERAGDQYALLQEALANNKPKKGKKGKKGKKKKK